MIEGDQQLQMATVGQKNAQNCRFTNNKSGEENLNINIII